ncbi:MAG: bifunctional heptose 7-phosphate kinase/heptose 1-phosphate adenyltransferase, partial [Vicinamibacterales bacterium]
ASLRSVGFGKLMVEIVRKFKAATVVVIGDLIADEYVYGRVARVSREAPVLILEYDSTEVVPGGAGNAASNAAALGGQVRLVSLVGRDEPGRRVQRALPSRVDRRGLVRPAGFRTPVKTRILAGGIHSAKQQVVRIDRLSSRPITDAERASVARAAHAAVRHADAVLISDYGSGLVTPALARDLADRVRRRGIPVLVDSRYALTRYRGLTACAPNESEVEQALGVRIDDDLRVLERAGRRILDRTRMSAVIVTRGSRGMAVFEPGKKTVHLPIFGSDQIADVTGAGDTVMATLTLALAAGATVEEAARLANVAGGLVVMKRGTATVGAAELTRALRSA